ncbi:MAG: hypothetical protein HY929_02605 [Euryarchaeota archaeon]|nr:hypothetical protein [Euryarchaeota archaeon]
MEKAQPKPNYERFYLRWNPFTDLSSESLFSFEEMHIRQSVDVDIDRTLSEVIDRKDRLALAIVGNLGIGKTQRLFKIKNAIEKAKGKGIIVKVELTNVVEVTKIIFDEVWRSIQEKQSIFTRAFNDLKYAFGLDKKRKAVLESTFETYYPKIFSEYLSKLLSRFKPSALLLDEFENVTSAYHEEQRLFYEFIREFLHVLPYSCLFAISITPAALDKIKNDFPSLPARFHRELVIDNLTNEEALSLVEKRLARERTTSAENIYPFTPKAIEFTNAIADGNPRKLVRILRDALAAAARNEKVLIIDEAFISQFVAQPKTLEEFLLRVPSNLREEVEVLITKFNGGPTTLIQIAKETDISPTVQYQRLEELVKLGFLRRDKVHYELPPEIRGSVTKLKTAGVTK